MIFTFFPLVQTFIISLSEYNKFSDYFDIKTLFSLDNYKNIFKDVEFTTALFNTLILVCFTVPISLFISLLIALSLNNVSKLFFKNLFKTFFFFPLLSNTVIMGMVFSVVFYYNFNIDNQPQGLFNRFLIFLNLSPRNWVSATAPYCNKIFALIVYNVWSRLSFKIFVFFIALQNINKSYYDAAKIDGASRLNIFLKITLPLIMPIIFYQFIIEMMEMFKEYESIIGVFGNNNDYKIRTIVAYIYAQSSDLSYNSYSKGATAAIILFFISVLFTVISFYISKKTNSLRYHINE
ncbi:MAG: sugar ABC transporter permease [Vigna little leaf phytoplasma]|nr:sugar ABC transporter permease [Vigna little leaf phytoplasma]